jgi:rod shape-determining protein MreD
VFENLTWLKAAAVVLTAMVVQDALMIQIVVLGAHPDLMIVLPVAAGILAGAEVGAVMGFFSGFAADILVPTPFGLSALIFVCVGYAVGALVFSAIGSDLRNARVFAAFVGSMAGTLFYAVVAFLIGQPVVLGSGLAATTAVVGIGAVVLAPAVFRAWMWAMSDMRRPGFGARMPRGGSALR